MFGEFSGSVKRKQSLLADRRRYSHYISAWLCIVINIDQSKKRTDQLNFTLRTGENNYIVSSFSSLPNATKKANSSL